MNGQSSETLERVYYNPPAQYGLDLEVLSLSDLRRRVSLDHLKSLQQLNFHLLIAVTEGECAHMVDFESISGRPNSWIVVRPGQIHRFDTQSHWDGWLIVFRPEFVLPSPILAMGEVKNCRSAASLPVHLMLSDREHQVCIACAKQMALDSQLNMAESLRHTLLRHQLYTLLLRLHSVQAGQKDPAEIAVASFMRFEQFRLAVDEEFARSHRVSDYAKKIGCSEKSLTRATLEAVGMSAKAYLSQRITLEAKRLLAFTSMPIHEIGTQIGFEEPTNFVKFFKHEVGCVPGQFRRQHADR